jgi:hypothetical protein
MVVTGAGLVTLVLLEAACGGAADPEPLEPLSAVGHERAARAHEREADVHAAAHRDAVARRAAEGYRCVDQPMVTAPTSGGQPLPLLKPCWTLELRTARDGDRVARAHRAEAARHRAAAADLVRVEHAACSGLGETELSHSPFFHREDVVRVDPVRRDRELVGARVVFRRVVGLDVVWMARATACHQARAAVMGFSPTFQSYCPLAVEGITVSVDDTVDGIAVTIRAPEPAAAELVWRRAVALPLDRATP